MHRKILLLNATSEAHSFIPEEKAFNLIFKDKVEVVSEWDDKIKWANGSMKFPATLRLKRYVKKVNNKLSFSRKAIIKRDNSSCQYCGKNLLLKEITIDHVHPKSLGGKSTFLNCVTACLPCNNRKGSKTLEQTGLKLIKQPIIPSFGFIHFRNQDEIWHPDWNFFIHSK